jgi:hypothetical protein
MADTTVTFAGSGNRTPGYLPTVNVVSTAGVTTNGANNYYNPEFVRTGSANGLTVVANRVYFNCIYISRPTTIRRLKVTSANISASGPTGSVILGIYSNGSDGLPNQLLYSSSSFAVGTAYTQNVAGSDAGLTTLFPGFYHLAAVFSLNGATMFGYNGSSVNYAHHGSTDHGAGYQNVVPWLPNSSFALPTSTSGITMYFHENAIASGTAPLRIEFGVTGA